MSSEPTVDHAPPSDPAPRLGDLLSSDVEAVLPRPSAYTQWGKSTFDIVVASLLLVLTAPLLLALAALVRLSLGRGVFYRQRRVGMGGREFVPYKFRTMSHDRRRTVAEPYHGIERRVCHKREDDPRHTRVGRFLRKSSLDELPQLLNVIKGEMSLVGPRPELVDIVRRYEPWQHRRHRVRPGLTGEWQTTQRGNMLMHQAVHLDIAYLSNVTLRHDVALVLRTVPAVVHGSGH